MPTSYIANNLAFTSTQTVDGRDVSVDGAALDAHVGSTSNPHSVTAAQAGAAPTSRTISTTAPMTGGGDLSADRTIAISAATTSDPGSMSAADKTKLDGVEALADVTDATNVAAAGAVMTTRTVSTTAPLTGGGDLSANRTLAISAATGSVPGSMSAADKTKLDLYPTTPIYYVPIAVVSSTAAGGAYGTSAVEYTPLVQGATDSLTFQVAMPVAGTAKVKLEYAMSAANAGNVRLQLSKLVIASGGDPNAALSASSAFTVTPGNDALKHEVSDATDSSFAFTVAAGDVIRVKIERPTASDTHTADMRILDLFVAVS